MSAAAPEDADHSNFPTDLTVCTIWGQRGINTDQWLADKFGEGQNPFFRAVQAAPSLDETRDCDLAVTITISRKGDHSAEVYSAYSKKHLLSLKTANDSKHALWTAIKSQGSLTYDTAAPTRLGKAVFSALPKSGANYSKIAREREEHAKSKALVRSADAVSSAGLGIKDIKALREILKEDADKPAPQEEIDSDIDHPRYRLKPRTDDFALIIGIAKYQSLPPASYAQRDAAAMRAHLIAQGIPERNIVSLVGSQATLTGIKKYIEEWLPRNTKPGSRIFFYFSGHGAPSVETQQAFLVPWDGDAAFLNSTAYPIKKLYAQLAKLDSSEVIVALDTCFSGSGGRSVLAKGARPLVTKVEDIAPEMDKITVFSAASSTEIAGSLDKEGHGIFTYYFIKGIAGEAKDASGRVTARGLQDYLNPRVADAARRQNRDQSPALSARGKDLVLTQY